MIARTAEPAAPAQPPWPRSTAGALPAGSAERWRDLDYTNFKRRMLERFAIDLASYKSPQMRRRLRLLMERSQARTFTEYFRVLERRPDKQQEFQAFFTINVSEFFRNPRKFRYLGEHVLPELLARRSALRIWSAGCSYGAEPYSLACLLGAHPGEPRHYLLATDVDERILERARAAADYTEQDIRALPPESLERWFKPTGSGRWALDPALRSRVTFRVHDLLRDSFEGDFDLILCRNVAIYFTSDAQRKLFQRLSDALRPGGYLFLGPSEFIREGADIRLSETTTPSFYRKEP
ncbi:MAG TPA: protein-glutamate O-methyltransferase CheR [Chloroflexota bacterium]|nr:protein-glutamate O-methyltransferase CheR [Chloroflexota bacterium]